MANPLWKAGMKAVNPTGRPKHSVRTVKGMIERFVKRNITPNKLQWMYDELSNKDQLNMMIQLLPYVAQKQGSIDSMSESDVDKLYDQLMKAMNKTHDKAKAS